MFVPGTNGFLNVIGSLLALRDCEGDSVWSQAMRDVRWVIGEVLEAKRSRGYVYYISSIVA